jgi:hypothetical protein
MGFEWPERRLRSRLLMLDAGSAGSKAVAGRAVNRLGACFDLEP